MRILFIDRISWDYTLQTPYERPLGGSQSALCYLADHLSQRGHQISLFKFNNVPHIEIVRGVPHFPLSLLTAEFLEYLNPEVAILLNRGFGNQDLRAMLPPATRLVLWTQHAYNQPAVAPLRDPQEQALYDHVVLISDWQRQTYIEHFQLPPNKITILRNAIAPCFENLFADSDSILAHKTPHLTLAYTSTPFRGLNLLLEVMPQIHAAHPTATLNVYSSMKVYHQTDEDDKYADLYQRCQALPGVNYIGSLPQPDLVQALRTTTIWAYPNTFAETSCIAALEAMASGCYLITSAFGALPETTAGFADLIPYPQDTAAYLSAYGHALHRALDRFSQPEHWPALEDHLRAQVTYIHQHCTWSLRAKEWEAFLTSLVSPTLSITALPRWQARLRDYLQQRRYAEVITLCDTLSEQFPTAHCWLAYQGAAYVLQAQEAEAQLLWSVYLSEFDAAEQEEISTDWANCLLELAGVPSLTIDMQFALTSYAYEFAATPRNGLQLLYRSLQLRLPEPDIQDLLSQLLGVLSQPLEITPSDTDTLIASIKALLKNYSDLAEVPLFVKALSGHAELRPLLETLLFEHLNNDPAKFASRLAEPYLELATKQWGLYEFLSRVCAKGKVPELALHCANRLFDFPATPLRQDMSVTAKLHVLQTFKYDLSYAQTVKALYQEWLEGSQDSNHYLAEQTQQQAIDFGSIFYAIASYFHLCHQVDQPAQIKPIYNDRNRIFHDYGRYLLPVEPYYKPSQPQQTLPSNSSKIRVGFIGSCFFEHPASHQIRAFIRLCDRGRFELFAYNPWSRTAKADRLAEWFEATFTQFRKCDINAGEIAQQIYEDRIDLLIDLDSCTSDITFQLLSLKPAPVQATWVGFDAIGLPTVDYFIVDPYILPAGAQAWYTETLWRLPHCYLSLDGYDVANKTSIRKHLGLGDDTVVFLCAQRASKIQPEMLKLQLAIVAAVKNAVLVIKYHQSSTLFEQWCRDVASAEGFDLSKLHFLTSDVPEVHRANLYDVDVVLDTYPYVGGAMSLEALWLEVPIVTKVGQQFVARHTYTFLKNVGVTDGIARSDEEYVNWGIRMGTEPELRRHVCWQLRQAKRSAPLWNPQQHAREMEQALTAMVNRYRSGDLVVPLGHHVGA
ncbi:O-linked N-acetylglucosamine transferase family protein [Parathermosynechococcus lividus]